MRFYFMDYENVGVDGFNGLSRLDANAVVIIFYSENRNGLTFGLHRRLGDANAEIKYCNVDISKNTKNALDFQLSFYMGSICKEHPGAEIFVVSKDTGYDCLEKLTKQFKCTFNRVFDLTGYITVSEDVKLRKSICECLNSSNVCLEENIEETVEFIAEKIRTLKSKSAIHNNIQKYLKDSKKASSIIKAIRPLLKDKT